MIRRNPEIPDNIFELARHETIGDYARTYGDEIARRYEDLNIIYFPFFPLSIDLEFLYALEFPPELKKIGTRNGIGQPVFRRTGDVVAFDPSPILFKAFPQKLLVGYLQSHIAAVNWQVRDALRLLLPRYYSLNDGNITWRMTPTIDEGMHLDGFMGGKPTPAHLKGVFHRIKLFINVDTEPRKWRTTCTVPEVMKRYRGRFPNGLPDDIDLLAHHLQDSVLELPYHEIDIPPMGAVLGEGACVPHAVRYGRRLIAAECFCSRSDMLDPDKQPDIAARRWLADAGIALDPDPKAIDLSARKNVYVA